MNLHVIRNKAQLNDLVELLQKERLPLKVAFQPIYLNRSVDANDYYWAVVLDRISKATGHDPITVHEGYKKMFNFRWEFHFNKQTDRFEVVPEDSTATLDSKEFWDYIFRVRADAEVDLEIVIEMPNEQFENDLNFAYEQ